MNSTDFWGVAFASPHIQEQGSRRGQFGQTTTLEERNSYRLEYRARGKQHHLFTEDNDRAAIEYVAKRMMLLTPLRVTAFVQAGGHRIVRVTGGQTRQIFPHEPRPPH